MTTRNALKYTLLFPSISSLLLVTNVLVVKERYSDIGFTILSILFICICLWGLGLLIALFFCVIFKKPQKEPLFYFGGQLLIVLTLIGIFSYTAFVNHIHNEKFGNLEYNHDFVQLDKIENDGYWTKSYVKKAFILLESQFKNKNEFRLKEYFSNHVDSINESYSDTLRTIYFIYDIKNRKEVFSKIQIFENTATIIVLNGNTKQDHDFLEARQKYLLGRKREIELYNKSVKTLPDSIKNELPDNLRKLE